MDIVKSWVIFYSPCVLKISCKLTVSPRSIFCIGILIDMLILKVMSKITPLVKNCIVEVQHMMNCRQQKFDSCGMDYLNSAGKFPEWIHQSNVIWIWHLQQGRSPSSKSSHGSFLNNYWIDCYKSSRVIVSRDMSKILPLMPQFIEFSIVSWSLGV